MKFDTLIVEDNTSMRHMLQETLEAEGWKIDSAADGEEAIDKINANDYSVVLTDIRLPGKKDGLAVMQAVKTIDPSISVIIMTAFGTIELAVQAMKEGATDFLTKPFDTSLLILRIRRTLDQQRLLTEHLLLKEELSEHIKTPMILGKSPTFLKVIEDIKKVGQGDTTVLLLGESGTGKELIARAIHHLSTRNNFPFVALNCAAIPDNLLESELFGYERGAFTGAERKKTGKFELADKGSIFLDEIGDMSFNLQSKLLRVLQEREFERVGGTKTISVNVRIIAASNQNLGKLVRESRFRNDLFYRLSVFPITLPPLRERKDDISILANHFIQRYCMEFNKPLMKLSNESLKKLTNYQWPGNIRELQNCIERAVILTIDQTIRPDVLGFADLETPTEINLSNIPLEGNLQEVSQLARTIVEKQLISAILKRTAGNKFQAAKELKVNYKTLLSKIREYKLEPGFESSDFE